jgi:hypothetical protein
MWMQASGLEWIYRLLQEPKRLWKRYLIGNLEFVWHIALWGLRNPPPGAAEPPAPIEGREQDSRERSIRAAS